jgi:hypothetical protein
LTTTAASETDAPGGRLAVLRIAIGLIQGWALFGLHEASKGTDAPSILFGATFLFTLLWPVAALGALGAMRPRTTAIWLSAAGVILLGVGAYDGAARSTGGAIPGPGAIVAAAAALFIGHHLVLAADQARRWIAPYGVYFDGGWRDGVRLALSAAFVGALWLLLGLGAALFSLIGVKAFGEVISKPWFVLPVTATFFAFGVHLTDVRANLVLGVRTVALTLLSYLLPVMALIALGFETALVFTGLDPLWKTRSATAILLSAAAALIVLINAAYQEGEGAGAPPWSLKWSARAAAWIAAPLVVIAAYALWLRVAQYGLTPERIVAAAGVLIAVGYTAGYALAAVRRGPWLKGIERANVVVAHLVVAVLLALVSPIASPWRLSVDDQVRRLAAGRVTPEAFDYRFLRFQAGRHGERALAKLAARRGGARDVRIAALAKEAQAAKERHAYEGAIVPMAERAANVAVAGGGKLPADFLAQGWEGSENPLWGCENAEPRCAAVVADLNGDGAVEVVVLRSPRREVYRKAQGRWVKAGAYLGSFCAAEGEAFAQGRFRLSPPEPGWPDLEVAGRRLRFQEETDCASEAQGSAERRGD